MIVDYTRKTFNPVTVTFETKEELAAFVAPYGDTSQHERNELAMERFGFKAEDCFATWNELDSLLRSCS